ncbi:MAG: hypothetical protein H6738_24880 [Alphaproteobacteria bacterium]|nr:hypothetical protein [Alphaproteobacteria bacterium]MCB9700046.1 hypothetical protein [Alphaproteobacteria bacterium]
MIFPFASSQDGLGALLGIGLLLVWGLSAPVATLSGLACIAWNLVRGRLGGLGVVFQLLVGLGNLAVALMGVLLAISLIGAPGVEILVGAACSAPASLAVAVALAATGVRARRQRED